MFLNFELEVKSSLIGHWGRNLLKLDIGGEIFLNSALRVKFFFIWYWSRNLPSLVTNLSGIFELSEAKRYGESKAAFV